MFRSILVAVDGSDHSQRALSEAVDLARSGEARLTLITVATPPSLPIGTGPYMVALPPEDELKREAEAIAEQASSSVPDDVPVATAVREGSALALRSLSGS
jgi:nucleotide-binding universal stress UspA family protein